MVKQIESHTSRQRSRLDELIALGEARLSIYHNRKDYRDCIDSILKLSTRFFRDKPSDIIRLAVLGQIDPATMRGKNAWHCFDRGDHTENPDFTYGKLYDPANLPVIKGRRYFRCNLCEDIMIDEKPSFLSYKWRKAQSRKRQFGQISYECGRCKFGVITPINPRTFKFVEPPARGEEIPYDLLMIEQQKPSNDVERKLLAKAADQAITLEERDTIWALIEKRRKKQP